MIIENNCKFTIILSKIQASFLPLFHSDVYNISPCYVPFIVFYKFCYRFFFLYLYSFPFCCFFCISLFCISFIPSNKLVVQIKSLYILYNNVYLLFFLFFEKKFVLFVVCLEKLSYLCTRKRGDTS